VTHGLSTSNRFRLYVHRNGGNFIGLCAELREVIEGSTADDIIAKARVLIDSVASCAGKQKPRITVRMSPNDHSHTLRTR
jgi:hypothetical protein